MLSLGSSHSAIELHPRFSLFNEATSYGAERRNLYGRIESPESAATAADEGEEAHILPLNYTRLSVAFGNLPEEENGVFPFGLSLSLSEGSL